MTSPPELAGSMNAQSRWFPMIISTYLLIYCFATYFWLAPSLEWMAGTSVWHFLKQLPTTESFLLSMAFFALALQYVVSISHEYLMSTALLFFAGSCFGVLRTLTLIVATDVLHFVFPKCFIIGRNSMAFIYHSVVCLVCNISIFVLSLLSFLLKLICELTTPPSFYSWSKLKLKSTHSGVNGILFISVLFYLFTTTHSADESSYSSGPPRFPATRIKYGGWLVEFCGWIAMKYPDLVALIEDEWEEPDEPAADADADDRKPYDTYWHAQKRLYGALIQAMPASVRQALAANAKFHGTEALELLKTRFGVVDAHDRSSALARVQKSYITAGSGISLKDATRQLDKMTEAHTEWQDAGGAELDDELLISYFLRAFPASYQSIKMALRTQGLDAFNEVTEAFLRQVKQAEDDNNDHQNRPAFSAQQQQQQQQFQQPQQYGARGYGGKGRGRGQGRGGRGVPSFVTCLRCGVLGHSRNMCAQVVARCAHCAADHLSALCLRGPGGAQREALTQGAREQDVQRAAQGGAIAQHDPMANFFAQMQQQFSALAANPAAAPAPPQPPPQPPAPTAPAPAAPLQQGNVAPQIDAAHLAQAFRQLYPQFGANAQQSGLFVSQSSALTPVTVGFACLRFLAALVLALIPFNIHLRGGGGDHGNDDDGNAGIERTWRLLLRPMQVQFVESEVPTSIWPQADEPMLESNELSFDTVSDEPTLESNECQCPCRSNGPCTNIHPLEANGITTLCNEILSDGRCNCPCRSCDPPDVDELILEQNLPLDNKLFETCDLLAGFHQCDLSDNLGVCPREPDLLDLDVCLCNWKDSMAPVFSELVKHVTLARWGCERDVYGLPPFLPGELESQPDAEIWHVDQLENLEKLWRSKVLESIYFSDKKLTSREISSLQSVCATNTAIASGGTQYEMCKALCDASPTTLISPLPMELMDFRSRSECIETPILQRLIMLRGVSLEDFPDFLWQVGAA